MYSLDVNETHKVTRIMTNDVISLPGNDAHYVVLGVKTQPTHTKMAVQLQRIYPSDGFVPYLEFKNDIEVSVHSHLY